MRPEELGRAEVLLACDSGGHLFQLLALREAWEGCSRVWVTKRTIDAESLLADECVLFGHQAERQLRNGIHRIALAWLRNIALAWRVVGRTRPAVVLTTGGAVAVPCAWIGRLRGARVVYVESLTRIHAPSVSCRLVAPVASRIYVQWPELARALPRARYVGSLLPGP